MHSRFLGRDLSERLNRDARALGDPAPPDMRPGQRFMRTEVWQYNMAAPIARVFWMRIDMAGGLLPMVGRDSYIKGRGRMLASWRRRCS